MEVGGLGFVHTVASTIKGDSQPSSGTSFLGILSPLMTEFIPKSDELSTGKTDIQKEDLLHLIQFLKTDDILDLENGMELYKDALGTDEPQELLTLIVRFLMGDTAPVKQEHKPEGLGHHLMIEKLNLEDMMDALQQLAALPVKDLGQSLYAEMKDIVKIMRTFELLANEQGLNKEQGQIKELLQQITRKLEQLAEQSKVIVAEPAKQTSRMEHLQRTFQLAVTDIQANVTRASAKGEPPTEAKVDFAGGPLQHQQMSKAEQLTLTLNQFGKPTTAADLIKKFENILARSQFTNVAGTQKLLIKLNPEHLGSLRIELIQREAGIVAKIMTTTKVAREALESQLNGLRQAFGSQNIQVDRVEISQALNQQQDRFLGRDGQQSQQQWQEKQEKQNRGEETEEQAFNFSLEEALVNTEV